jgi:hypothetical protein
MTCQEYNAKLCGLLLEKRVTQQLIEREVRQYPGARSRFEHRKAARIIYGWHELLTEIKALKTVDIEL